MHDDDIVPVFYAECAGADCRAQINGFWPDLHYLAMVNSGLRSQCGLEPTMARCTLEPEPEPGTGVAAGHSSKTGAALPVPMPPRADHHALMQKYRSIGIFL